MGNWRSSSTAASPATPEQKAESSLCWFEIECRRGISPYDVRFRVILDSSVFSMPILNLVYTTVCIGDAIPICALERASVDELVSWIRMFLQAASKEPESRRPLLASILVQIWKEIRKVPMRVMENALDNVRKHLSDRAFSAKVWRNPDPHFVLLSRHFGVDTDDDDGGEERDPLDAWRIQHCMPVALHKDLERDFALTTRDEALLQQAFENAVNGSDEWYVLDKELWDHPAPYVWGVETMLVYPKKHQARQPRMPTRRNPPRSTKKRPRVDDDDDSYDGKRKIL